MSYLVLQLTIMLDTHLSISVILTKKALII